MKLFPSLFLKWKLLLNNLVKIHVIWYSVTKINHFYIWRVFWWKSREIAAPYLSTFWENSWRPLGSGILSATSTIGPQVWPQPCYCKVYYPQEKLQIYASVQVYCNIWVVGKMHDNKQVVEVPRWRVIKCYLSKSQATAGSSSCPHSFPFHAAGQCWVSIFLQVARAET